MYIVHYSLLKEFTCGDEFHVAVSVQCPASSWLMFTYRELLSIIHSMAASRVSLARQGGEPGAGDGVAVAGEQGEETLFTLPGESCQWTSRPAGHCEQCSRCKHGKHRAQERGEEGQTVFTGGLNSSASPWLTLLHLSTPQCHHTVITIITSLQSQVGSTSNNKELIFIVLRTPFTLVSFYSISEMWTENVRHLNSVFCLLRLFPIIFWWLSALRLDDENHFSYAIMISSIGQYSLWTLHFWL